MQWVDALEDEGRQSRHARSCHYWRQYCDPQVGVNLCRGRTPRKGVLLQQQPQWRSALAPSTLLHPPSPRLAVDNTSNRQQRNAMNAMLAAAYPPLVLPRAQFIRSPPPASWYSTVVSLDQPHEPRAIHSAIGYNLPPIALRGGDVNGDVHGDVNGDVQGTGMDAEGMDVHLLAETQRLIEVEMQRRQRDGMGMLWVAVKEEHHQPKVHHQPTLTEWGRTRDR